MKLIIAGSRHIEASTDLIEEAILHFGIDELNIEEIVSGGAEGVDAGGELYADMIGEKKKKFLPDYDTFDKKQAPLERNTEMAEYADALLLIWDGQSHGSRNVLTKMVDKGKPVYEMLLRKQ